MTGTVNVFEAAKRHGVIQISQASSIAVFGTSSRVYLAEGDAGLTVIAL